MEKGHFIMSANNTAWLQCDSKNGEESSSFWQIGDFQLWEHYKKVCWVEKPCSHREHSKHLVVNSFQQADVSGITLREIT